MAMTTGENLYTRALSRRLLVPALCIYWQESAACNRQGVWCLNLWQWAAATLCINVDRRSRNLEYFQAVALHGYWLVHVEGSDAWNGGIVVVGTKQTRDVGERIAGVAERSLYEGG